MGNAGELARDLSDRVPGQSLIEMLLAQWDAGRIRLDEAGRAVIDDEARGWYWGVLGERRVATILDGAPSDWTVLHSIPIGSGGADVDHLAITPGGVFTINTKYSPGSKVWAAGHGLLVNSISRANYLRNAAREAVRVESRLSEACGFAVPVSPVITFVAPHSLSRKAASEVDGTLIRVTSDIDLVASISIRRELSDEQLARIADAARLPQTWRIPPSPRPGYRLAQEFDALREAVGPALDSTRPASEETAPKATWRAASRRPADRPASTRRPASRRGSRRTSPWVDALTRLISLAVGGAALWFGYNLLIGMLTHH